MTCTFCKQDVPKLINAHIIPRSFFKVLRGAGKYSTLVQVSQTRTDIKAKQAGLSDDKILCEKCERLFKYDAHGFEVIRDTFVANKILSCADNLNRPAGLLLQNLDYVKFKLFVLSMLWRASVSKMQFFQQVNLGSHEERIKNMIVQGDPGSEDEYSIFCFTYLNEKYPGKILPPMRFHDGSHYRFYLPGVMFLVEIAQKSIPAEFSVIRLRPPPPHELLFLPSVGSIEDVFMDNAAKMIRSNRKR